MPRPRRTKPRPSNTLNARRQNRGQNRNVQMRNNQRAARPQPFGQSFQGGIGQGQPGGVPGGQNATGGPGAPPVSAQQNQMQCPTGQKPEMGPDGRPTCVPDMQQGPGANPQRRPGVNPGNNIPTSNAKNVQGR